MQLLKEQSIMPTTSKLDYFKKTLKELFLTKEGWISWIIANIITSVPWAAPLILGFILKNDALYSVAASIWAFIMLPITPFWILNVIIAVWFTKLFTKKHIKKSL
jgi:hypothetical protein